MEPGLSGVTCCHVMFWRFHSIKHILFSVTSSVRELDPSYTVRAHVQTGSPHRRRLTTAGPSHEVTADRSLLLMMSLQHDSYDRSCDPLIQTLRKRSMSCRHADPSCSEACSASQNTWSHLPFVFCHFLPAVSHVTPHVAEERQRSRPVNLYDQPVVLKL